MYHVSRSRCHVLLPQSQLRYRRTLVMFSRETMPPSSTLLHSTKLCGKPTGVQDTSDVLASEVRAPSEAGLGCILADAPGRNRRPVHLNVSPHTKELSSPRSVLLSLDEKGMTQILTEERKRKHRDLQLKPSCNKSHDVHRDPVSRPESPFRRKLRARQ